MRADRIQASRDVEEKGGVVEGESAARADRVPWLVRTGFPDHLQGLRDLEIRSSYTLPPPMKPASGSPDGNGEDEGGDKGEGPASRGSESDLCRIVAAAEVYLRDAYALCSDRSTEQKLTEQRAKRRSRFSEAAASGTGNPSARRIKQLLVFYYRVIFCEDSHFTREGNDQVLPRDVIKTTEWQAGAIEAIISRLQEQDEERGQRGERGEEGEDKEEDDQILKHGIRKLYLALVCQMLFGQPFESPVLSFCAMLSRKDVYIAGRGADGKQSPTATRTTPRRTWREPGNFNSDLSALVWTAQLVLFEFVCFTKRDREAEIADLLEELCQKYFHQMAETPFGHILQWRLYLFSASRDAQAEEQARWSLDGQTINYRGTKLHMDQVPQLVSSEFRQAHSLLYDELLLGCKDISPVEAWRLEDDLDTDEYGDSWLRDPRNADVLGPTEDALLLEIESRESLRQAFVQTEGRSRQGTSAGPQFRPEAVDVYESHVQEFLRRMVTLIHVPAAPPLRAPELLSIVYVNTGRRRRSVLIWEKMVMVYVRYHKSQEKMGAETVNIRFLPKAIGEPLLTYLAVVQPLRQAFLRQAKPGALLSPYLWSTLDGQVWRDSMVSSCLRRACARAEVPQFQVAWWRQAAASIAKQKFSAGEKANFNLADAAASEEVEDEEELADLAGLSNHSFRTFNNAYAGSTTLAATTALHRAYRASYSWRTLFRVDQVLLQSTKRPRDISDDQAQGLLMAACKKARIRTVPSATEEGLVSVARHLYNDGKLQLRRPGQRDAMLAVLGPRPPDQVVVILGTGSGKTLVVMVAASLVGAATTVLILPTVALRGNMVGRLADVGLRHHVWEQVSKRVAPVVIVSAEAACTEGFLDYAHRLVDRQQLDRIVIDECHLTITASSYRRCMARLAWHVRQIRVQTVWLTATLPPVYLKHFVEHNKLLRPRVVRESTNRANLRYLVQRRSGPGSLTERVIEVVQECCERDDMFDRARDRIIVYCSTKEVVYEVAGRMGCQSYTAETGTEEEKGAVINRWLHAGEDEWPVIVATSALGPGFDYAHVRFVIHLGPPSMMTDFSQESGRGQAGEVVLK
ncbi:hypothetical protein FALCPG4_018036 [Fusarium falciforme]